MTDDPKTTIRHPVARVLGWACLALTVAVGAGLAGFWLGVGAGWW